MKILVTGATGFLGGALARWLRARGDDVTVLGRNPVLLAKLEREGMRSLRADLADRSSSFIAARCPRPGARRGSFIAPMWSGRRT